MNLLVRSVGVAVLLALTAGCAASRNTPIQPPTVAIGEIGSTNEYGVALNQLALMGADDPARPQLRAKLQDYLLDDAERLLDGGEPEMAITRLEHVASLYAPAELREDRTDPRLVAVARRLYSEAAKSGNEMPALFCLAIEWQFGDQADKRRVDDDWERLNVWIERGSEYSRDPMMAGDAEQLLERAASVFPSPWLNDKVAEVYLRRYLANQAEGGGLSLGAQRDPRIEFTGYLIARLYLRADAPESALAVLDRLDLDKPSRALRDMIAEMVETEDINRINELIAYFEPTNDGHLPPAVVTQGWGIVEQLARRGVRIAPDDPRANLSLARSFHQSGLNRAAVVHYERALSGGEESFATWAELAAAYQMVIAQEADRDAHAAAGQLPALEAFHERAADRWRDRPIYPGINAAHVTVAAALFDAGDPAKAQAILEKSVSVEPLPETLDLLGSIALKLGKTGEAKKRYESLTQLPFSDQYMRLNWEIRAHEQLALIAVAQGDRAASEHHLRAELLQLNSLLSLRLPEPELASRLVQRCTVFLYLGETDMAMDDFHRAASAMPDEAGVYADPLLFTVSHGYLEEARQIYRRAIVREHLDADLKLYFSLWVQDLAIRQEGRRVSEATRYIESYKGGRWQMLLARHARAQLTYDELLAQAGNKGEQAEAYFYGGLTAWTEGRHDTSLDLMNRVVETGMVSFFEYEMAQHYLSWRDLPKTARAPIAAR